MGVRRREDRIVAGLLSAFAAQGETLYERDGITLEGAQRLLQSAWPLHGASLPHFTGRVRVLVPLLEQLHAGIAVEPADARNRC